MAAVNARAVLLCLGLTAALGAQPAPIRSTTERDSDEIVTLSEFSVSANELGSYVASETMSGSRVNQRIENLPYVVNVVTAEFLKDFAFFDLHDEEFTYTSAYVPADSPNGGVQIRGHSAAKTLRNGFSRIGSIVDAVNIDRIEIIRGPSATVYGENRPGGIVNVISKRPKTKPGYRATLAAGTYDFIRGELEATGPLTASRNTAYLFTAANQERGYESDFAKFRRRAISGALVHRLLPATSLMLEVEHLKQHTGSRATVALANDSSQPATRRVTRLATPAEVPRAFNAAGPHTYSNREVNSGTLSLEHRFNPVFSLRAALAYFTIHRTDWTNPLTVSYELAGANAGTVGARTPGWGYIDERAYMSQVDLLARHPLAGGRLESVSLFTVDFVSNYHIDPQFALPTAGANSIADLVARGLYAQRLNPRAGNNLGQPPTESIATRPTRFRLNRADDLGLLFRQQITAGRGRFIAAAGGRFDFVKFRLQDKLQERLTGDAARNVTENTEDTAFTPNAGVNIALTPRVRGYVNYAKSYYVDTQNRTAGTAVQTNEGGYGWDYGFKINLLDQRLNFTLGGWYIERTNITVTEFDPITLINQTRTVGAVLSRGVELDANWRLTEALSATFGGSRVTSLFTENGNDIDSLGRQQPRLPRDSAYLTLRHTGLLKGFSTNIGASYTGESKPFTATGGIAEPATSPNRNRILSHDGRRDIIIPSYVAMRFGASYTWKAANRRSNALSVNITNPFNRRFILNSTRWNEPFHLVVTNTLTF